MCSAASPGRAAGDAHIVAQRIQPRSGLRPFHRGARGSSNRVRERVPNRVLPLLRFLCSRRDQCPPTGKEQVGNENGQRTFIVAPRPRCDKIGRKCQINQRPFLTMVGGRGIEPLTPSMSRKCSPAELTAYLFRCSQRAREGTRYGKSSAARLVRTWQSYFTIRSYRIVFGIASFAEFYI
jgi:hypothetical protein